MCASAPRLRAARVRFPHAELDVDMAAKVIRGYVQVPLAATPNKPTPLAI
jgi:hypothetical protein